MEEIAILELKQKRLITMLSQIDPVIYLQKLQQELSALQVPETLLNFLLNMPKVFTFFNFVGDQQKTETDQHCGEAGAKSEGDK